MNLHSFTDVDAELAQYIPAVKAVTGTDTTVERMRPLMKLLGNPENKLHIIHIAGTSGKTSTAYFIAELLSRTGKKVGLTVSPHLCAINERVQINMQPLPEPVFCQELSECLQRIQAAKLQPTYYELLIAFAYWYFAKAGVAYAIVETGLGGLYDSTNIATNADKICVITDIGLDHTQILGNTLPEIAAQKAGIIHPHNQVFIHPQTEEILDVIRKAASTHGATLNVLSKSHASDSGALSLPLYQQRNWQLAREVVAYIATRDSFAFPDQPLPPHVVPGRMQPKQVNETTVIFDGAHNPQKMTAFVTSFQQEFPGQKVPVLLDLKQQKEYQEILPVLLPITSELILTRYQNQSRELPDTEAITALAKMPVTVELDPQAAFRLLVSRLAPLAVVTGSLYLVGRLLKETN